MQNLIYSAYFLADLLTTNRHFMNFFILAIYRTLIVSKAKLVYGIQIYVEQISFKKVHIIEILNESVNLVLFILHILYQVNFPEIFIFPTGSRLIN